MLVGIAYGSVADSAQSECFFCISISLEPYSQSDQLISRVPADVAGSSTESLFRGFSFEVAYSTKTVPRFVPWAVVSSFLGTGRSWRLNGLPLV